MLILSQRDHDQIKAHTKAALPLECCGLIIGRISKNGDYIVERLIASENVATKDKTKHFEIDPKVRFDLLRAERDGLLGRNRLIGFYHSHPFGKAQPSETDRSMVYEPELLWVIANDKEVKAFSFDLDKQDFFDVFISIQQC
jgi:desampylase